MIGAGSRITKGVRLLCALALLFVGFAHKAPVMGGPSVQSAELSQYVFPDGTPHVLCLPGEIDDGEHRSLNFTSGCEACRLSASILPPMPEDTTGWLIRLPVNNPAPPRKETLHRRLLQPNTAPRGPPFRPNPEITAVLTAIISACAG